MDKAKRPEKGRGVFYTRDSGGKHECTPSQYIAWASREASRQGVQFTGVPEQIEAMIRDGRFASGDIFLDYDVPGHIAIRNGLNALDEEIKHDPRISHVYIPRRDRLSRAEDPLDAAQLENTLRRLGVHIVYMDKVVPPIQPGQRCDYGDVFSQLSDFKASSDYVYDLAQKGIHAQLQLAQRGFSTGGRPPYGFMRCLVTEDGSVVQELHEGVEMKKPGCHVDWQPDKRTIGTALRVFEMLETMPASRVAAALNAERVPPPDAGRARTDSGVKHLTRGVWNETSVTNIGRNSLLCGIKQYGRRSMGRLMRATPEGPRLLEAEEILQEKKFKVVINPVDKRVEAPAHFEPVISQERFERLQNILDARAGSQRGKPRHRTPGSNPLGARVYDMNCGWPMYRGPYNGTFRYSCGGYMQSNGTMCDHNWVYGPKAVGFVLTCIQQRLLNPEMLALVEKALAERAECEFRQNGDGTMLKTAQVRLLDLDRNLAKAAENMALAETPLQRSETAKVVEKLAAERTALEKHISEAKRQTVSRGNAKEEVGAAMALAHRLLTLAQRPDDQVGLTQLFTGTNARLFLRFEPAMWGKRRTNRIAGGVVTFGAAPLPIEPYQGRTSKKEVAVLAAPVCSPAAACGDAISSPANNLNTDGKVDSLGNVGRGEWNCSLLRFDLTPHQIMALQLGLAA